MLTVSVVLYKTPVSQIIKCIKSLHEYSCDFFMYVVDNSPDDLLRKCFDLYHNIEYTHMPDNPGYGRAHNYAIKKALNNGSVYHLVLNSDIYFDYDVLSPMIRFMNDNPDVAQLMPKVLNVDGSLQFLCKLVPTPFDFFVRRFLFGNFTKKYNYDFELRWSNYDKVMFVPYLSGCFMLFRIRCLESIGFFDERFFMYPEDIDLTRRLAEHYQTIFFPNVSVYHEYGAASKKSFKMLFVHIREIIKYFNKWGWFRDPLRVSLNNKTIRQFD